MASEFSEFIDPEPTPKERIDKLCKIIGPLMTSCAVNPGQPLVYLRSWQDGGEPPVVARERLVLLDATVEALLEDNAGSASTVRAFLRGSNRLLGDRAMLMVIAQEPIGVAGPLVLNALDRMTN